MPFGMFRASTRRRLVKAHRVRKACLEKIVIARGEPLQHVGKRIALVPVNSGIAPM